MVRINHINGDEKLVTRGAFESIFKPLGYKLVVEKEVKKELTGEKKEEVKPVEDKKENKNIEDKVEPKPVENKEEIKDKRK